MPAPAGLRALRLLPAKEATTPQLLEARGQVQRMLAQIPLTEEERAAVEDDAAAVERLLARLAAVPTPDGGPPPGERGRWQLPVVAPPPRVAPGDASDARDAVGGDRGGMVGVG